MGLLKRSTTVIAALVLVGALAASSVAVAPASQDGASAAKLTKKKCKKIKDKEKRAKCLKKLKQQTAGSAPAPAPGSPPATGIRATTLTVDCQQPAGQPCGGSGPFSWSVNCGIDITLVGQLAPDTGGTPITIHYHTGPANNPAKEATVATDAGGNFSFSYNPDDGGSTGTGDIADATFFGDSTRTAALAPLQFSC